MKQVIIPHRGKSSVLRVEEAPDPTPGPGEVRIRVHAAAVNPTDTMLRAGLARAWFEGRPAPYVPGMDAAGVVDAIGPDTDTPLRPGDPVAAIVQAYGGAAALAVGATTFITGAVVPPALPAGGLSITSRRRA